MGGIVWPERENEVQGDLQDHAETKKEDGANDTFEILSIERVSTIHLKNGIPQRSLSQKRLRERGEASVSGRQQKVKQTLPSQHQTRRTSFLNSENHYGFDFELSQIPHPPSPVSNAVDTDDIVELLPNWAMNFYRSGSPTSLHGSSGDDYHIAEHQKCTAGTSQEISPVCNATRLKTKSGVSLETHWTLAVADRYQPPSCPTICMPSSLHKVREKRKSSIIAGHKPEQFSRRSTFIVAPPRKTHDSVMLTEDLSCKHRTNSQLRMAILLFIFGFLFPPLWIVGSLLPVSQKRPWGEQSGPAQRLVFWKVLNVSMLALAIVAGLSTALVLLIVHRQIK